MSVAWTTILVIGLLLPGILFFVGLASYERLSREIIRSSVVSEVAMAIFVAVLIHAAIIALMSAFGFRLGLFLDPLADYENISTRQFLDRVLAHVDGLLAYFSVTALFGLLLGHFAARGIVSGPLRRLAVHKWIYDIIDRDRKGGIVTAFVMTTIVENNRILMYRGRVHEIFLGIDGKISYIALKNCSRYYMILEGSEPTTSKQLELFGSRVRPQALWDYLLIDGANIANTLFDSSPEIKETTEGAEALEAAFREALKRYPGGPR
jgi:hypothetical protein